jgi:hypothetical protein
VIAQELVGLANVEQGADFFPCFLREAQGGDPQVNRFSLFEDNLHLNGLGQVFFAHKWSEALTGVPVVPGAWCDVPIFIVEALQPQTYKQNLIEVGNEPYVDEAYTVASVPAALAGAVWIEPENADAGQTASAGVVSFDVGASPVTVYVAYDAGATPPNWLAAKGFTLSNPLLQVALAGAPVGALNLYRAQSQTGVIDLGGNAGPGAAGAQVNYIPIVVEQ